MLVTDGEPNGCNSTVDSVSALAAQARATVKTYVVSLGAPPELNRIAAAGGSDRAFIVKRADAKQTQEAVVEAIQKIRGAALPCEIDVPRPKSGETLDFAKLNLTLTSGANTAELASSKDCANGDGWRYDDPAKPTRIALCAKTCEGTKQGGKLSVTLGCDTKGDWPM